MAVAEIKLKPCPICGYVSTVLIKKVKSWDAPYGYIIGCSNCNTFFPVHEVGERTIMFGEHAGEKIIVTDEEAINSLIDKWNTRAE